MAKRSATPAVLEIPLSWGDVSIGESTCRIGCTVQRDKLTLSKADAQLCGKRLVGRIVAVPGSDNPEQRQLIADETEVAGAFDVKRISFNKKALSFGLTFSIESVRVEDLAHFAKRAGRIVVEEITDIPADDAEGEE